MRIATINLFIFGILLLHSCISEQQKNEKSGNTEETDTNNVQPAIKDTFQYRACYRCELFQETPSEVSVYDTIDGSIIETFVLDTTYEYVSYFILLGHYKNNIHVKAWLDRMDDSVIDTMTGWITTTENIGVYHQAEGELFSDLILYNEASKKSDSTIVENWRHTLIQVNNCSSEFKHVTIYHEGARYEGWMENRLLCNNPLSTCS